MLVTRVFQASFAATAWTAAGWCLSQRDARSEAREQRGREKSDRRRFRSLQSTGRGEKARQGKSTSGRRFDYTVGIAATARAPLQHSTWNVRGAGKLCPQRMAIHRGPQHSTWNARRAGKLCPQRLAIHRGPQHSTWNVRRAGRCARNTWQSTVILSIPRGMFVELATRVEVARRLRRLAPQPARMRPPSQPSTWNARRALPAMPPAGHHHGIRKSARNDSPHRQRMDPILHFP
jgi:hypothetical protein